MLKDWIKGKAIIIKGKEIQKTYCKTSFQEKLKYSLKEEEEGERMTKKRRLQ